MAENQERPKANTSGLDLAAIVEMCDNYIREVQAGNGEYKPATETDTWVFEEVMRGLYGPDVFDKHINPYF